MELVQLARFAKRFQPPSFILLPCLFLGKINYFSRTQVHRLRTNYEPIFQRLDGIHPCWLGRIIYDTAFVYRVGSNRNYADFQAAVHNHVDKTELCVSVGLMSKCTSNCCALHWKQLWRCSRPWAKKKGTIRLINSSGTWLNTLIRFSYTEMQCKENVYSWTHGHMSIPYNHLQVVCRIDATLVEWLIFRLNLKGCT